MNTEAINAAISAIMVKRNELAALNYSDKAYDDIEDGVHELEDLLIEAFGDYLEEIIEEVMAEVSNDTDVLLPTSYLASKYVSKGVLENGDEDISLEKDSGVEVNLKDSKGLDARLVLVPNPTRILLNVRGEVKDELWRL